MLREKSKSQKNIHSSKQFTLEGQAKVNNISFRALKHVCHKTIKNIMEVIKAKFSRVVASGMRG